MFSFLASLNYRTKLNLAFLLLSVIPIAGIGTFFQISFSKNIEEHVFDKLVSIRDSKKSELIQHISNIKSSARLFSQSNHVRYSVSPYLGFVYAFNLIDKDPDVAAKKLSDTYKKNKNFFGLGRQFRNQNDGYAETYFRFNDGFQDFVRSTSFSNILLLTPQGQIIFTTDKADYFGQNIAYEKIKNSPVASIYREVLKRQTSGENLKNIVEFIDFSWDKTAKQEVSYLAFPIIQHNRFNGIIVYAIPETSLTNITGRRDGLGKTGEAYLIGEDYLPRSQLVAIGKNQRDYSLEVLSLNGQKLETQATQLALSERKSIVKANNYIGISSLSAFDYLDFLGKKWALIVEISEAEALEKSIYFRDLIWGVGLIIILLIIGIVYYLSDSMTKPLKSLTHATEMVSKGDLDLPIKGSSRNDELGSLARSFVIMQESIRKQIALVSDVNDELKEKVTTIETQNEDLQAADKLKDEFLANTSHELRTPLNGIIGITESLLDGAAGLFTKAQSAQLKMVSNSANRLALLVNDLLDFHKIKHNQLRVNISAVAVPMVVNHIIELTKHLIGSKNIEITKNLPDNMALILADPIRFEQILFNLVGNAIKYTNKGNIEISALQEAGHMVFKVTDTGIGISEDDLEHIFEPFEQADGGITRKIGGSGLGLTISRKLVELMDGKMSVETRLDIGSTFCFDLPIADESCAVNYANVSEPVVDSEENEALKYIEAERLLGLFSRDIQDVVFEPLPVVATRETILVVDDEKINLQILHNHLSLMGYNVLVAEDAEQAFSCLAEENPVLIILDVMLPDISGFEIARIIREDYDLYELPILMLTARAQITDLVEGFNAGANDYLVKPFLKDELIARVRTLLEARQAVERLKENTKLKEEVSRRLETEEELRNSQRRMLRMLDSIEDAIITFNGFDQIAFFNQAAHLKLGFPINEMIGKNIERIIPQSLIGEIRSKLERTDREQIILEINKADGQIVTMPAYIARVGGFRSDDLAIILHQLDDHSGSHKLPAIKSALSDAQNIIEHEGVQYLTDINYAAEEESHDQSREKQRIEYRHLLVDIMNDSLKLWEQSSGLEKIDIAEKSKIWRVYMDRSSLQTRTLDKYFLEETLPVKPRWRDVLRTGNFVLKYIDGLDDPKKFAQFTSNPQLDRLQKDLVRLKNYVGK
uniref:histidine kinase n=1 Tax=OCS116 cluster bacterium TaxID=2030921 RepID=A0A2A4YU27_9PROT